MTRRLAIVNLSNWPNETFKVDEQIIAPGEFISINSWEIASAKQIEIVATDDPDAERGYHPWGMNVYQPEAN